MACMEILRDLWRGVHLNVEDVTLAGFSIWTMKIVLKLPNDDDLRISEIIQI